MYDKIEALYISYTVSPSHNTSYVSDHDSNPGYRMSRTVFTARTPEFQQLSSTSKLATSPIPSRPRSGHLMHHPPRVHLLQTILRSMITLSPLLANNRASSRRPKPPGNVLSSISHQMLLQAEPELQQLQLELQLPLLRLQVLQLRLSQPLLFRLLLSRPVVSLRLVASRLEGSLVRARRASRLVNPFPLSPCPRPETTSLKARPIPKSRSLVRS